MVSVEHLNGENVKKALSCTIITQLNLLNILLLYAQISSFFIASKMVLSSSNTRLTRPGALRTELFIAFLEHEKHALSSKVLFVCSIFPQNCQEDCFVNVRRLSADDANWWNLIQKLINSGTLTLVFFETHNINLRWIKPA